MRARVIGSAAVPERSPGDGAASRAPSVLARLLLLACLGSLLLGASHDAIPTVDLVPPDRADWRPGNLFSWLRPGPNYDTRTAPVENSPAGAVLDLFSV